MQGAFSSVCFLQLLTLLHDRLDLIFDGSSPLHGSHSLSARSLPKVQLEFR